MVIERGDVYWADLGPISDGDHRPAKRRPVLVIQSDAYNASRLATVIVAVLTSNTKTGNLPGNTVLPSAATGLPRDSAVNVTALLTLNRDELEQPRAGHVPRELMRAVDAGLAQTLGLVLAP
ncbi:type II toxin-antitoxin system PemK/MazF family toxin [Salana multivorans]